MLILASNSPRRKQLVTLLGWDFVTMPAQVDESVLPGELPEVYVRRLAESKARAVFDLLEKPVQPGTVILAADTAVVNGVLSAGQPAPTRPVRSSAGFKILGKPANAEEAERMLRNLRGRTHQVYTALAAMKIPAGQVMNQVCITDVPMRHYSDVEMLAYIASGDPMDKAGAYAIQNPDFKPVHNLHGCFANVMGLPVCHLVRLMEELGVPPTRNVPQACQALLNYHCPVFGQILGEGHPFVSGL